MRTIHARVCCAALFVFGLLAAGMAQVANDAAPPPSAPPKFSAAELEKLAAPIALHPDPLIALILPASVYPLEVVQAARLVKDTNNIPKVAEQKWDENVKSLAMFPAVIQMMNDDLEWTMALGQAFVGQQKELMDTVQSLRARAQTAGTLKTTPQQIVVVTNTIIERTVEQRVVFVTNTVVQIQPSNPQVIYVPTYPSTVYYYTPPPVYAGPPPAVTFAAGIAVGAIIANNSCDWHHGSVHVVHHGSVHVVHHGGVGVGRVGGVGVGRVGVGGVGVGGVGGVGVGGGGVHHGRTDVDVDISRNVNVNNTTINNPNRPAATPTARESAFGGGSGANTREFSSRGTSSRDGKRRR